MENERKEDDVPDQNNAAPPVNKPEKDHPNPPPHKTEKYCPYALYIPTRSTQGNVFQSNCSTMIWHWDKIPPYTKPLKRS